MVNIALEAAQRNQDFILTRWCLLLLERQESNDIGYGVYDEEASGRRDLLRVATHVGAALPRQMVSSHRSM